jgi:hypothetical protein
MLDVTLPSRIRERQQALNDATASLLAGETPIEDAPAIDEKQGSDPESIQQDEVRTMEPAPINKVETDTPPEPRENPSLQAEVTRLTAALSTLNGKYNAEVPRLQDEAKQLRAVIIERDAERARLTQQIGELEEQLQEAIDSAQFAEKGSEEYFRQMGLDEEEIEAIGPSTLQAIDKLAEAKAERATKSSKKALDEIKAQADKAREAEWARARRDYHQYLDTHVPDWESLPNDPRFNEWFSKSSPGYRENRGARLQAAIDVADAESVVDMLKAYKNDNASVATAADQIPAFNKGDHVKPTSGAASVSEKPANNGWTFSDEEYKRMLRAYRQAGTLPYEKYDEYQKAFYAFKANKK